MFPRTWTVTIEGHTLNVVAGTREAAEKIGARRLAGGRRRAVRAGLSASRAS
jgi:hypothetical protein